MMQHAHQAWAASGSAMQYNHNVTPFLSVYLLAESASSHYIQKISAKQSCIYIN